MFILNFSQVIEIVLLGVALSMDAFAVSVCKGIAMRRADSRGAAIVGAWFGGFQALMPFLGYMLIDLLMRLMSGTAAQNVIEAIDHWIAFVLLVIIGINMIRESKHDDCDVKSGSLAFGTMFAMAIATSIDALATGVAIRMTGETNIYIAIAIIGVITFGFAFFGVKAGNMLGAKFRQKAQIVGGVVLILIGAKIVIEHLFF